MDIVHYHFDTIDSSNNWAKKNVHLFETEGIALITATEQTAGRGRFNRHWVSPAQENIYATFCFFVDKQRKDLGNIPQVLALSCAKTLESFKFTPTLRWPNDILLEDKKVAGILCETTPADEKLCFIAGIGVNVNMPLTYLEEIDRPATSLKVIQDRDFDHLEILNHLENIFVKDLLIFLSGGFSPFIDAYRQRMSLPKKKLLSFHDNLRIWEGYFHRINDDGTLELRLPSGEIKTFNAGEFTQ